MISSGQLKAARALLGIDQRELADLCAVSLPTIQRMETSIGTVRGTIDSLVKIVSALDRAGVELIGESGESVGLGRGVRLKETMAQRDAAALQAARKPTHVKSKVRPVKR
jgi:transcriptional regulator with XRE-family HTH domain